MAIPLYLQDKFRPKALRISFGGGGGDSPDHMTIMYAGYIEAVHKQVLSHDSVHTVPTLCVIEAMNAAFNQSPYSSYSQVSAEAGFLGEGYTLNQFPALFDMYGKFMAGLDIEVLWSQIYENNVHGEDLDAAVTSFGNMLSDQIDEKVYPKFLAGYRDINAVMSSAFVVAKALIANEQVKQTAEFVSKLQFKMVDIAQERWVKHLGWNTGMIVQYADLQKLYYSTKFDADGRNTEFAVKDELWNLSLFEYARAMVGALNGAAAATPRSEPSQAAKSIAMAAAGSAAGAQLGQAIGGEGSSGAAWGAGAGALLGLGASFG